MDSKTKIVAASLFALGCTPALAIPIVGINDPLNNTADFEFSVESQSLLRVDLTNTSNWLALITGFGFDIDNGTPDGTLTVAGTLNDTGWHFAFDVNGANTPDLEAFAITGNNLNGGDPQSAIEAGSTGTFDFGGAFLGGSSVSNILVRFQQTGSDGEGSDRGYICATNCTPTQVPEPSSLLLTGLGLTMLSIVRRRRNKTGIPS